MSHDLYAVPVSLGCIAYVLILEYAPTYTAQGASAYMLLIFGFRAVAICCNLHVPKYFITQSC